MGSDGAVTVTESTTVQVTMKQLLIVLGLLVASLVGLGGVAIGAASSIVGGLREDVKINVGALRDDVKEIRLAVQGLQNSNADLGKQLAALTVSVSNLSSRIDDIQKQSSIDPGRFAATLAEQLKKNGVDDQKIVIVPVPQR